MFVTTVSRIAILVTLFVLGDDAVPSKELTQTVNRVGTLRSARAAHTATTLRSGEVLMVGGMADGGNSLSSAELFDPERNTLQEAGALADSRSGHTATLLPNGRVLIAGGYNGQYLRSLEVFDPVAKRFRSAGSLLEGRSGH